MLGKRGIFFALLFLALAGVVLGFCEEPEAVAEAAPFDWLAYLVPRVFFVLCVSLITLGMHLAKKGYRFNIRPIPGLNEMEEAVGRATEMGRPSLFCTGVSDTAHPELYASMPILNKIATVSARYRNRLLIPVCMVSEDELINIIRQ